GIQDLLDYATEAVKEGAGKTTLEAFAASLAVLEQVGKFDEDGMLSRDTTWIAFSKNVTAELVEKGPTLHQAAQPTVAMVLSLELFLNDGDRPKYARAMAFVALVMLWGSMRADDIQCMRPESMRLTIEGFSCKLWKTKTTGPDRRVNMVQVFISRKAGFSGTDWLQNGMRLWSEIDVRRDFLVLQAAEDWETCTDRGVDASTVALYLRKIFKELCTPRWHEGQEKGYVEADALDALQAFAEQRGEVGAVIRARHELVRPSKTGGNPRLGGRFPPLFFQNMQVPLVVPDELEEDGHPAAFPKGDARYFVSVSKKTGFRRLHVNHACYVKPFKCQDVLYLDQVTAADFDAVCKDCKVRIRSMTNEDRAEESSSGEATTSSSEYEYRMRKEAFRLVNEDGMTLKAALLAVTKDTEMKE
ncbi:unnamed protein product, partial [Symbiodinium sp. CCMP2456]